MLAAREAIVPLVSAAILRRKPARKRRRRPSPPDGANPQEELTMARAVATHLMFEGTAEEAMKLYVSLFPKSEIRDIERYGPGEPGKEGSVKRADFTLGGHDLICIDSPVKHAFTFTPSASIFVDCESEAELEEVYNRLSEGGTLLMPLDNYGFSTKFGWLQD